VNASAAYSNSSRHLAQLSGAGVLAVLATANVGALKHALSHSDELFISGQASGSYQVYLLAQVFGLVGLNFLRTDDRRCCRVRYQRIIMVTGCTKGYYSLRIGRLPSDQQLATQAKGGCGNLRRHIVKIIILPHRFRAAILAARLGKTSAKTGIVRSQFRAWFS
jgi:hypothetical protein